MQNVVHNLLINFTESVEHAMGLACSPIHSDKSMHLYTLLYLWFYRTLIIYAVLIAHNSIFFHGTDKIKVCIYTRFKFLSSIDSIITVIYSAL